LVAQAATAVTQVLTAVQALAVQALAATRLVVMVEQL
jgi:hypothetical protein